MTHVVEPTLPGARDSYINLGKAYDDARLERRRGELRCLTARYKAAYNEAYHYLSAAGRLTKDPPGADETALAALTDQCLSLIPYSAPASGEDLHVFLDAFCCRGQLFLADNLTDMQHYSIRASESDGSALLTGLAAVLRRNGYRILYCHAPLRPALLRHLLLPDLHIAFSVTRESKTAPAFSLPIPKADSLLEALHASLLSAAEQKLTQAKQAHDALEEVYNPCVDFSLIRREAERHIHTIL